MAHPWMTSDELIACVSRKIAVPISQITFTDDDILSFVNEEFAISQVPSVLIMHEEYFVQSEDVIILPNQPRYPIPDRAIGMKLRDLFYKDEQGNLFKMTQIAEEEKAFFQQNLGSSNVLHKYYIEGNDVVLSPTPTNPPIGYLTFNFFLRPNQLVRDARAAIISSFSKLVAVNSSLLNDGDTLAINGVTFTARSASPGLNEFLIGVTDIATATNLSTVVNTNGIVTSSNGTPSTGVVTFSYPMLSTIFVSSNVTALSINPLQTIQFSSIPTNILSNTIVDFLQTKPGHKIRNYDVLIPIGGVSGTSISFNASDVPQDLQVGDYVCSENECIIPQIPPDLHNGLAERACARILSSMGDAAGLQASNDKIAQITKSEGTLLDNRVDGSPRKVTNRYSLLNQGTIGPRRRF